MSSIQWRRFAFFDKDIISESVIQNNNEENTNGKCI